MSDFFHLPNRSSRTDNSSAMFSFVDKDWEVPDMMFRGRDSFISLFCLHMLSLWYYGNSYLVIKGLEK